MKCPDPRSGLMAAVLLLAACGGKEAPPEAKRFVYPPPEPRKATHVPEGLGEWLKLLENMRQQIGELEKKIAEHQSMHQATPFDELLTLDPDTLQKDQLSYLWHFADKGYFTVEREIMVKVLEDRRTNPLAKEAETDIAGRAKNLALEYEQRLRDLQIATELYEQTKHGDFTVPGRLDEDQLAVLRGMVREKLAAARSEVARLDARIAELNGPQIEPPKPPAAPAVESQQPIPDEMPESEGSAEEVPGSRDSR